MDFKCLTSAPGHTLNILTAVAWMLLWKRKMIICEDQVRNRKIDLEAEMLTVLLETIVLVVQPREETNRNLNLETDIPDLARGMYNGSKQAVL